MAAAAPKLAGLIGWPLAHARSPALFAYWFKEQGVAGHYQAFPVHPDRVGEALRGLVALGIAGCNVTIPHKQAVIAHLDHVDDAARTMGAVNLIVADEHGKLHGRNTDGYGFIQSLHADAPQWSGASGPAVVLGAGGASRAVVHALLGAGAPEVRLLNRTRGRAEDIAQALGKRVTVLDWDQRDIALGGAALLVNTTSQGMSGHEKLTLTLNDLPRDAVVTDIVYNPLETDLLAAARKRGNVAVDGLGMLLHQARPAFEAWFGVRPEVTPGLRAALATTL